MKSLSSGVAGRVAAANGRRARPLRLQRTSPLPLYFQLKRAIEERIEAGSWAPDAQLPSERQLCDQFGISRITVRQALDELVREGRLVRSHGRGTYVAQPHLRKPVYPLVSFTYDMQSHGMQAGARVLRFDVVAPPPHVMAALELGPADNMILLKRLRLANGRPMAVETVHLPGARVPGLLSEDLNDRSLYDTLNEKFQILPDHASQQWQAVACPNSDARLLGLTRGSPVLRIEQTTYDRDGRPFEHMESFFRGDKFVFVAELSNRSAAQM